MFRNVALAAGVLCVALSGLVFAAQDPVLMDKSRIPALAGNVKEFVPPGWKIEDQLTGDLNGDAMPDHVLKLVEDKPAKDQDDVVTERARALVIALASKDGKLSRAGVADKLLQCTRCGGAFYGVVEAPANVEIDKGSIVVNQDHGSREFTNTTYRFRYDPDTQKFVLIGFDYAQADRMTAQVVSESSNYLTGVRKVARDTGEKTLHSSTRIPRTKIFLEQVDSEKFEAAVAKRLGL
jgi:hypothetical protein